MGHKRGRTSQEPAKRPAVKAGARDASGTPDWGCYETKSQLCGAVKSWHYRTVASTRRESGRGRASRHQTNNDLPTVSRWPSSCPLYGRRKTLYSGLRGLSRARHPCWHAYPALAELSAVGHGAQAAVPDGETRQALGVVPADLRSAVSVWSLRLEAGCSWTASPTTSGDRSTSEAGRPRIPGDAAAL